MIVYAKFTVTKKWLDRDCFNVDIPNLLNAQWSGLERSKESVNRYIYIFLHTDYENCCTLHMLNMLLFLLYTFVQKRRSIKHYPNVKCHNYLYGDSRG